MRCSSYHILIVTGAMVLLESASFGQNADIAPKTAALPVTGAVAATVNGAAIPEVAVQRTLKRLPPGKQAERRAEILNFLIDNMLIDQYLLQLKIEVAAAEVDAHVKEVRDDIQKQGSTFEKLMQGLMLTEPELRENIAGQLRWDKFTASQATHSRLKEFFDRNREMFDGSMVRASHILLMPSANGYAQDEAKTRLAAFKKQIEETVTAEIEKLPPNTDNLGREKLRIKAMRDAFGTLAEKESACPSKAQGGDLGWFPRAGSMVEPFARTAFALKPYELSDVITTQFGQHLIMVTDRRPGKETKFEDVEDGVKEVYAERLREMLAGQLRSKAKIMVNPTP